MSFLNSTAHLHHRTLLPATASLDKSLEIFQNHDILIRLDPDLAHYEEDTSPAVPQPNTKYYTITDHMQALPGIWDTTVSYRASITNVDNGVKWVINAPLGLEQKSSWTVETATAEDLAGESSLDARLVLVEDVNFKCSRLIIGTVKSKCEAHWKKIHAKWLEHLADVEKKRAAGTGNTNGAADGTVVAA